MTNTITIPFQDFRAISGLVFLDIDGVLNGAKTTTSFVTPSGTKIMGICPDLVATLNRLVDACPDVRFVMSSTWRAYYDATLAYLAQQGFKGKFVGHTTMSRYNYDDTALLPASSDDVIDRPARGAQIKDFLSRFCYKGKFVALDDDLDCDVLKSLWIATDPDTGLTDADIDRAVQILSPLPT